MVRSLESAPLLKCGVQPCDRPVEKLGLCGVHYARKRSGLPMVPVPKRGDLSRVNDGQKWCHRCERFVSVDGYTKDVTRPDGISAYCRECRKKIPRKPRTRTQQRTSWLKKKYGIAIEEYETMLAAQGGVCAVCRKPESVLGRTGDTRALSVDHNHKTGDIRGLLCHYCNLALGAVNDDIELLHSLIRYLQKYEKV